MPLLICLTLLSLLGCSSHPTSSSTPRSERAAAGSGRASTGAYDSDPPSTPRTAEHANPGSDTLGTLPEGYGIPVGQPSPDATVRDMDGAEVRLSSLWSERPLLLVFYRGGWCPFCNFQLHALTEAFPGFNERGIGLAAISVDRAEEGARTAASWEIPFPVLSDQDLVAHEAFHVGNAVDDEMLERLRSMGMDLEAHSGREHHVIAVPAIFLIGTDGVVTWAHADLDYRTRPSPEQVLGAIP